VTAFELIQAVVVGGGIIVAIVRIEQSAKASAKRVDDLKTDMASQHDDLKGEIRTLFGQTRDHEADLRELKVRAEEQGARIKEHRGHIDHIGREIGIGKRAAVGRATPIQGA